MKERNTRRLRRKFGVYKTPRKKVLKFVPVQHVESKKKKKTLTVYSYLHTRASQNEVSKFKIFVRRQNMVDEILYF